VVAAHSLRGFTLVTQCYAFARLYSTWLLGRLDKARALVRHTLRHLPEDPLLHQAATALGVSAPALSTTLPVATPAANPLPAARAPRVMWANAYCLLDTTSGASMAVRQLLLQLQQAGCEINILGASIFDHPRGVERLSAAWDDIKARRGQWVKIEDGPLNHMLLVTEGITRRSMLAYEEGLWFNGFMAEVERLQPDMVLFYGGQVLDMLMTAEARSRGIPVAAFLCNGNFRGQRWCKDVDLILTDSRATAKRYAEQDNLTLVPVGAFIDPAPVLTDTRLRRHVLFVNPSLEKGAALVCALAAMLEQRRPDIVFEVVESRGNWQQVVRDITTLLGQPREALSNVVVTPNTPDMRPVYSRARVLLAPSFWYESFGRVAPRPSLTTFRSFMRTTGACPRWWAKLGWRSTCRMTPASPLTVGCRHRKVWRGWQLS